eukprot:498072-Rhodomonas_salina.1
MGAPLDVASTQTVFGQAERCRIWLAELGLGDGEDGIGKKGLAVSRQQHRIGRPGQDSATASRLDNHHDRSVMPH